METEQQTSASQSTLEGETLHLKRSLFPKLLQVPYTTTTSFCAATEKVSVVNHHDHSIGRAKGPPTSTTSASAPPCVEETTTVRRLVCRWWEPKGLL